MSEEEKKDRKAKWDQPEIEDFEAAQPLEELERKPYCRPQHDGCRPQHDGCRPMSGGCPPMGCGPGHGCRPSQQWVCAPRKACYPYIGFQIFNPYCRPYGFNYGYGCFPRS